LLKLEEKQLGILECLLSRKKKTNSCVIREGIKDKESEEKEEAQTFLHFSSSKKK